MERVYTSKQIAEAMGCNISTIARKSQRESWPYTKRPGRGGGKLFKFIDLPKYVQTTITIYEAKHLPAPTSCYDESKPIPDKAHQVGLAKFNLLNDWLKNRTNKKPKNKADAVFFAAYNSGVSHPDIFKLIGKVKKKTVQGWDKNIRNNGGDYRCLCDRRGWDKDYGPRGDIGPEAEEIFLRIYLNPNRPSGALAYDAMCSILDRREIKRPSKRTTYRFIQRYESDHNDVLTLMREGEKALADKIGPYITRDSSLLEVGDCLVADGHTLNFDSIDPRTGKPARMTLICWFDWASRIPVGWEVMPTEDTVAISSALFMAIKNLGKIPKCIYLDNGKAFKSKYFFETNPDLTMLTGLYARLGIAVQFSKAYQARTKVVERFFGTFSEQCARLLPSYRGRSIDDKPAYLARNEKFHKARHDDRVPTIGDTLEIWCSYLTWYGSQPHEGLHGMKPMETFMAGRGPGVDVSELTRHFLWRKQVNPRRCRVRLFGIDFESESLYGLKKPVLAMWSWADMSQIHLYTTDGYSLGSARPVEALHPLARHLGDELDMQKIRDAVKYQAKLKKQTLQLAREADAPDALEQLPWVGTAAKQRVPLTVVPKEKPAEPSRPKLSKKEQKQLAAALDAEAEAMANAPAYQVPRFSRPFDKAEFLFNQLVANGHRLTPEDQEFMARYWASPEYNVVSGRFDALIQYHEQISGEPVVLPWVDSTQNAAAGNTREV
jgi:putative transposase